MEKIVCLLQVDKPANELLPWIEKSLLPVLTKTAANHIHFAITDEVVSPALPRRWVNESNEFNVYLTFWLPTALQLDSWLAADPENQFTQLLQSSGRNLRHYVVTESTVMDATSDLMGKEKIERLPGWQQVVPLKIPTTITREQWLATWLYSHADIACETQSTFGYIHNIVQRTTLATERNVDAIVTENFPEAAMEDDAVFYDAVNDTARLANNQKAMMESCDRFIDNSDIAVVPMSAYRVNL